MSTSRQMPSNCWLALPPCLWWYITSEWMENVSLYGKRDTYLEDIQTLIEKTLDQHWVTLQYLLKLFGPQLLPKKIRGNNNTIPHETITEINLNTRCDCIFALQILGVSTCKYILLKSNTLVDSRYGEWKFKSLVTLGGNSFGCPQSKSSMTIIRWL